MRHATIKIFLALIAFAGASACQPHGEQPVNNESPPASEAADLPEGAIKVSDKLYMVPVSTDETGCQQYSAHAVGGFAPTVIYYRRADGSFTEDRTEADCA